MSSTEHPYVAFADDAELERAAAGFLSEGLSQGQQVGYFGWGSVDALRGRVRGVVGVDELIGRGALQVTSLDERFRPDEVPDPSTLVSFWAVATDAALESGFSALRVVTDTTPWAEKRAQRDAFLCTERFVDRYRLEQPFAQLCVGSRAVLSEDALAEVACIHASSVVGEVAFHLHAAVHADLALDGEVDAFAAPLLERVVDCIRRDDTSQQLVIDASGLTFIGHQSLIALERHAERSNTTTLTLRGPSRSARHLAELLGLQRVRVEPAW
jgi:anti-anti-sigma regulatory factor